MTRGSRERHARRITDALTARQEQGAEGRSLDDFLYAAEAAGVPVRDITPPPGHYRSSQYVISEMGCPMTFIVTERNGYLHSVELLRRVDTEYFV
jgi:hypothetical protein